MTLHPSQQSYPSIAMLSAVIISTALLAGCNNTSSATSTMTTASSATVAAVSPAVQAVVGDYVSDSYSQRHQGYDWVAVMVQADDNKEGIHIKVRSRHDIKTPTCTFDGQAKLMGQDQAHGVIFETIANDSKVFLQFQNGKLTIDSDDKYALNYYCSGGASIVGEYQKLQTNLELS
ncbi:hypothetical protein ACS8E3_02360 [Psychrobacter sp. 2Y5]|uniref:hypothetical protein n=1 Tax=unclassified Psychrobacter TaxID=196806 RepID=UPI003F48A9EE